MSQTNILLESGTNELELVEFYIDEKPDASGQTYRGYYGVNVAKVLEIIRMPAVTQLPEIPHPSVMGAFNLRSRIIPLVDLSLWLGKGVSEVKDSTKVIVSEFNRMISAFMVSGVTRIHRLSWTQVEAPGRHLNEYSGNSVTGVVRFEDRILLVLDMEKIVADLNPGLAMKLEEGAMASIEEAKRPAKKEHFRALIADDSTSIRRMIGSMLEKAGFEVTQTVNGQEAWDTLMDLKRRSAEEGKPLSEFVDIMVSDIEMPVMDGHNLTKRVKDDPVLKEMPVILFSSLITDRLRHKGESVGADEQISKPNITELTKRAFELIAQHQNIEL
ncbi:MAG: chemotaxis protein [Humidesulfovibrio sp.]|uniref:chemotaxis protein n=1 Tax=Humidesulfovibrio sp. TaxID=2910988 RepID=UPI0027FF9C27|nr:chemotaxis protein [Humidesulfovibrio sp.]MDQ7836564.1 chemotaxis protein [Humidesulfovibrio sp.]